MKCSYCKKPLGNTYTFSLGFPGIPRVYGCDRYLCKLKRAEGSKIKWILRPTITKLYDWVNNEKPS